MVCFRCHDLVTAAPGTRWTHVGNVTSICYAACLPVIRKNAYSARYRTVIAVDNGTRDTCVTNADERGTSAQRTRGKHAASPADTEMCEYVSHCVLTKQFRYPGNARRNKGRPAYRCRISGVTDQCREVEPPPDGRTNRSYRTPRLGGQCPQGTVRRAAGGRPREAFSRRENGRRLMAQVRRFHARFIPFVPGTCAICQVKCPECETPPPPEAVRARVPPDAISAINHQHRSAGTS
jgi:hypothetical protein